ncbi:hypothetical protein BDR26DRAFT_463765 [Obelidium mucronatum]|nr:hypothetical protein BDR26DRAFT_463765 [Obelidium mucronatum]
MASNQMAESAAEEKVVLVAARSGTGLVASEDSLVFDVCKEDKILFAISDQELTNIPPSFAHAFAISPVTEAEKKRALRLKPQSFLVEALDSNDAASTDGKFTSRIRMSVMTNHVQDLESTMAKLEDAPNKSVVVVPDGDHEDSHVPDMSNAVVTVLNPFGAETDADLVAAEDQDYVAPESVQSATNNSSGSTTPANLLPPKRLTRASAFSILMDIR